MTVNFLKAYSKLFQTTLTDIRDKIDPVLKSTQSMKEENSSSRKDSEKEKKHDESKTRWEKEVKKESTDVEMVDVKKEVE